LPTPQKRGIHGGAGMGKEPRPAIQNAVVIQSELHCAPLCYAAPCLSYIAPYLRTNVLYRALEKYHSFVYLTAQQQDWKTPVANNIRVLTIKTERRERKYVKMTSQKCLTKYVKPF
jgi:hypothetical protein